MGATPSCRHAASTTSGQVPSRPRFRQRVDDVVERRRRALGLYDGARLFYRGDGFLRLHRPMYNVFVYPATACSDRQ